MELLILLIIALILLAWRINSDRMRKHSSFSSSFWDNDSTSSHYDDDIYTDPSYCHLPGNIYHHKCCKRDIIGLLFGDDDRSSIFDNHWSCSIWGDWTSRLFFDDDDRQSSSDDHRSSSTWDDWTSSESDDWGSSSWDSWSSSSWDS